jgi:hypothetical protein
MLRQKFETVQVVYLAHEKDLGQALSRSDTGGYVFVSHGASDEPAVMDEDGQLITRDEVKSLMQAARDRYIAKVLPPAIARLYAATRSADPTAASEARRALTGMSADDKALYKYVISESGKVHLDLSYVEHYSCYSGNEGAQDYADLLLGDDGTYVGYAGPTDSTGRAGRITFAGRTVPATRFRPKVGRASPDPDPVGTMRKKKPAPQDAAVLSLLQRTTKAVFALYGCRGGRQTELHYTKKTIDTSSCSGQADRVYVATVYPISWSGSAFSGTFTLPAGTGPNAQAGTITVSGSVDTVARRVTGIASTSTHSGEGWTLTESVNAADVPLQEEKFGYFTFVAEKDAFRGKLTGYQRLYNRKGEDPALGPREARERGVEPGVKYPSMRQEETALGDFVMEAPESMIRLSLTPTDLQGNRTSR